MLIDLNKCECMERRRFYVYARFISGAIVRISIKLSIFHNYL
jgi:hypothetical protein